MVPGADHISNLVKKGLVGSEPAPVGPPFSLPPCITAKIQDWACVMRDQKLPVYKETIIDSLKTLIGAHKLSSRFKTADGLWDFVALDHWWRRAVGRRGLLLALVDNRGGRGVMAGSCLLRGRRAPEAKGGRQRGEGGITACSAASSEAVAPPRPTRPAAGCASPTSSSRSPFNASSEPQ